MNDGSEFVESDLKAELARLRQALAESQAAVNRLQGELALLQPPGPVRAASRMRALVRGARRAGLLRTPSRTSAAPAVQGGPTPKQMLRARTGAELEGFLRTPGRLALPCAEHPAVSILLILFNQAPLTFACLRSIAATAGDDIEVIVVDNASSDRTAALLDRLDGVRVIRNPENRHFLLATNQAAAAARGAALLLLNNDACLRPGALAAASGVLAAEPAVGAVGGPIVLPDGTLQEAGSIIWNDGSCLGYGRGRYPTEAEFQFSRDVDYCSGAFLLVRRALFETLGGFDTAFAPAYYEETDFCMRLRHAGHRIAYHPLAVIDHYEFASAETTQAALDLQRRNHQLFADRHRETLLAGHLPQGTEPLLARMRAAEGARGRVLVIEDRVPFPAMGAGYPRAAALLQALIADGWFVTLYPLLFAEAQWDEVYGLLPRGLEVMLGKGEEGLAAFLNERAGYYDTIIVSRPHNMLIFLDKGGRDIAATGATRLIYDAEAVFATREFLRLALAGMPLSAARQEAELRQEMKLALTADQVITVSTREGDQFTAAGCRDVRVLGHAMVPQPTPAGSQARRDMLFVGALDDDPSPNTDSLLWFVAEVMPQLDALIGADWQLLVAGRAGAPRVRALAGPRIQILGRVEDLDPLYGQARLLIAPTRFAGGIPHKVHEAAARGVPVVATPLLAGQLGWSDGQELLVAETPEAFGGACARLYRDDELWTGLRERALARLAEDCDPALFTAGVAAIMAPAEARRRLAARPKPPPAPLHPQVWRLLTMARRARGAVGFLRENGLATTVARLRAELRLRTGARDFATWVRLYDTVRAPDRRAIAARIDRFATHPKYSVLLALAPSDEPAAVQRTIEGLLAQLYDGWQLCVADGSFDAAIAAVLHSRRGDDRIQLLPPAGSPATFLAATNGTFLIELRAGDVLRSHALYVLAAEHDSDPDLALIYSDEDRIDTRGLRTSPHFKPDPSPELFRDPHALGGLVALARSAAVAAGGLDDAHGAAAFYDLVLRVWEQADSFSVHHVPKILIHRTPPAPPMEAAQPVLTAHLARMAEPAEVTIGAHGPRILYALPDPPLVSVIVPTRDRVNLLRPLMQGLMAETDYPALEFIIVDNASRDPVTLRLFERLRRDARVRVLPFPYAFNYAAMNNRAVDAATGEIVLLLNNDIAIREPGWLREMVSQAMRPKVGAVGAKLLYGDGTVQHAGVATGIMSVAGHPFRHVPADHGGHHGSLFRVQSLSCVTAACMAVRRGVYQEIGGLDEVNLTVAYNDVDFCLRLRERGYRIVWTPFAALDHLESVSRGQDTNAENIERARREEAFMTRKWGAALGHDPFYNPNLTKSAEDYGLAFPPRVRSHWREEKRVLF